MDVRWCKALSLYVTDEARAIALPGFRPWGDLEPLVLLTLTAACYADRPPSWDTACRSSAVWLSVDPGAL